MPFCMSAHYKEIFRKALFFVPLFIVGGVFILLFRYWIGSKNAEITIPNCVNCNVVFISFDTLRADHVHALGYPKPTTPTIDALVNRGFVFTNAITVAPWTLPSP